MVDIAEGGFWAVFALGLLLLIPLQNERLRPWTQAVVNLALIKVVLFRGQFVAVLVALVLVWLLLDSIARKRHPGAGVVLLGMLALALFLRHKLPGALDLPAQRSIAGILAGLGFSYVFLRIIDMTRALAEGRHPPPSLAGTINYLLPFHMLAAGPIQSYDEFVAAPQRTLPLSPAQALAATERIARGLFKKFVIANAISQTALTGFSVSGWYFLLEVQLFYLWLYLDFSALSDLAVGIGGLLGLETPENFNKPYLARNIINFWERWHITLSQFIRRNLYFPVQMWLARSTGNSRPLLCSSVAFTVAFGLCGMWHAVDVRFLLWGLLHAAGLVMTNAYRDYLTKRLGAKGVRAYVANRAVKVVATVVTFEFVAFSLTIFQLPI